MLTKENILFYLVKFNNDNNFEIIDLIIIMFKFVKA